jgi:acylglycerol lipase
MKESLGQYTTRAGNSLSFRKWSGTKDVIVYLHGIESNSAWFAPLASRLNEDGFILYGIDRRGSGLNKEDRGDILDYNMFLDDIEDALKFVKEQNANKKIYVMGICWGGLLAVNYIVKKKIMPDGLILLSPSIYRKVDLNFFVKSLARIYSLFCPRSHFKIPIKDRMFTSNRRCLDIITKDTTRLKTLSLRFFREILRMERESSPINHKISLPVAVLLAGIDEIVDNKRVKEWFEKVESDDKAMKIFNDMHHVLPFEENIDPLISFITDWIGLHENRFALNQQP